ncbi:MAG: hypothetical protein ABSA40_05075 [Candidatus Dormibacteria bacterium]|jgi:hypothetical protein
MGAPAVDPTLPPSPEDVRDRRVAVFVAVLLGAGAALAGVHGDSVLADVCAVLAGLLLIVALSLCSLPALARRRSRRRCG